MKSSQFQKGGINSNTCINDEWNKEPEMILRKSKRITAADILEFKECFKHSEKLICWPDIEKQRKKVRRKLKIKQFIKRITTIFSKAGKN